MKNATLALALLPAIVVCQTAVAQTTFKTEYYSFTASTADEFNKATHDDRPDNAAGATRIVPIKVNFTNKQTKQGFVVSQITVTDEIIQTLPRWTDSATAKKCLQDQWSLFLVTLQAHEDIHKNKYAEYGKRLVSEGQAIPPQQTAPELSTSLKTLNEKIKSEIATWQKNFDAQTKFGWTSGLKKLAPC